MKYLFSIKTENDLFIYLYIFFSFIWLGNTFVRKMQSLHNSNFQETTKGD